LESRFALHPPIKAKIGGPLLMCGQLSAVHLPQECCTR
jgi:hypothetical protein